MARIRIRIEIFVKNYSNIRYNTGLYVNGEQMISVNDHQAMVTEVKKKFKKKKPEKKPAEGEKAAGRKSRPDLTKIKCYKCHEFGHCATSCPNGEESNIIEESIITEEDDDLDPEEIEKLMRGKLMEQDDEEDGEAWQDDIAPLSQIYDDHCEGDLVWRIPSSVRSL